MNKFALLAFVLFLAASNPLYAQDVVIEKDMFSRKTTYHVVRRKGIDTLTHIPLIKKNSRILTRITNLNPFAYSVVYQLSQQDVKQHFDSTQSLVGIFSGNVFADAIKQMRSSQEKDTAGAAASKGAGMTASDFRAAAAAALDSMQVFYEAQLLQLAYFNTMTEYLYSRKDSQATIEASLKQALADALKISPDELNTAPGVILNNLKQFSDTYGSVKRNADNALALYSADQKDDIKAVNDMLKKADQLYNKFTAPEVLSKLELMPSLPYQVRNASFTYEKYDFITQDIADLSVDVVNRRRVIPGVSVRDLDSGQVAVSIKEHINAKGEFVIRSSVGFAFPTFFNQSAAYGIKDAKVARFDEGGFVPNLATFINFYPFKGRFDNFGGVIGIGYPLTGKEKNMNIMLGVSEALGDKNFVIVNAGVAFAPTQQLTGGWRVDGAVPSGTTEVPTDKVWKAGVFIGVTLSLFNR